MFSAYRYRLYPKREQELRLNRSLLQLSTLYNTLRARKISEYQQHGTNLTLTDLRTMALKERTRNSELQAVHSQVAQNVADRLHASFTSYLEGRARFPKHKQPRKYHSLTYPQSGFQLRAHRLRLSKIGSIRIFQHRQPRGRIKRLTIKHEVGEWYAIFLTETSTQEKLPTDALKPERIRGADLGLETFAVLDDSQSIRSPHYLRQSQQKLKQLQRQLTNKKKNSKRWKQLCFRLARLHQHIARQRENFQNQQIAKLYKTNDALVLEKLQTQNLLRNHRLAYSISDAAFSQFIRKAMHKADMQGKHFVAVDPWGTSQFCHNCLTWVPKMLADREHKCPTCGEQLPRDANSAKLIKRLGRLGILSCPPPDGGSSPAEPKPLPTLRQGWQVEALKREAQRL